MAVTNCDLNHNHALHAKMKLVKYIHMLVALQEYLKPLLTITI